MDNDVGAAFDKLDQLLAAAHDAGPSIALLMELGRQQGLDSLVQRLVASADLLHILVARLPICDLPSCIENGLFVKLMLRIHGDVQFR